MAWAMAALGLPCAAATAAETYPSHPITLIVPFPPGGASDATARLLVDRLAAALGQPVTIVNQGGGVGGSAGVKAAAAAAADGYTLLLGTPGPLAIAPAINPAIGYDPMTVFVPVATVAMSPHVLTATPSLPAKSVHDLIAYAKANPGKVGYASPGYGSQSHVLGELLKTTAGVRLVHVPYPGTSAALADLLSGRVQLYFTGPAVIEPYIADGKLHPLAVASETRTRLLPEVPTMIESGFGRFIAYYWTGIVAPAGTPSAIVGRLNAAINDILRAASVQASLAKLGAEPKISMPEEAASFMAAEGQKWSVVARAAGIGVPP
jgi:tripartite-type tricarboxylate transporter receptor subunit TctC